MIHNIVKQDQGISIFCGIGERCREALDLYQEMRRDRGFAEYGDNLWADG
jgi:F0F1-type ATP synthase beta subunit